MALLDDIIAVCKQDRERKQDIVEKLESGDLIMKSRSGLESSWVDVESENIERYKRQIAELDVLIARNSETE